MKEFDVELAKAGHPLVTRSGYFVQEYIHFKNPLNDGSDAIAIIEGLKYSYTNGIFNTNSDGAMDLFLEDIIWEVPLQMGDTIEILDNDVWVDRIFIKHTNDGGVVFVSEVYDHVYKNGGAFLTYKRNADAWRRVQPKPNIEITAKVDGKEVQLADIEVETLLTIRKNSKL